MAIIDMDAVMARRITDDRSIVFGNCPIKKMHFPLQIDGCRVKSKLCFPGVFFDWRDNWIHFGTLKLKQLKIFFFQEFVDEGS